MKNKRYILGVLFIILSAIGFSSLQMLVKLSGDISIYNKIFFRNVVILFITYLVIRVKKVNLKVERSEWGLLFLRVSFGIVGVFINFYSVMLIYLSDLTMISKLSSFIFLILSYFILKEKFTKIQFIGLLFSFLSLILVVKPGTSSFSYGYIVALSGALTSAIAYLCIRILGMRNRINPLLIIFYFSLGTCIVMLPFSIYTPFEINIRNILYLIGIGVFGALGQYGITFAYKFASSREVSVFEYTQIVFASILGYVFLYEIPDIYSLFGYTLIIVIGIYMYIYNLKIENK